MYMYVYVYIYIYTRKDTLYKQASDVTWRDKLEVNNLLTFDVYLRLVNYKQTERQVYLFIYLKMPLPYSRFDLTSPLRTQTLFSLQ